MVESKELLSGGQKRFIYYFIPANFLLIGLIGFLVGVGGYFILGTVANFDILKEARKIDFFFCCGQMLDFANILLLVLLLLFWFFFWWFGGNNKSRSGFRKRNFLKQFRWFWGMGGMLLAVIVGFWLGWWRAGVVDEKSQGWAEGEYKGQGIVVKLPEEKDDYQRIYLLIKNIHQENDGEWQVDSEIITLFAPLNVEYHYGQEIFVECKLQNPVNQYQKFNYRRFLAGKGVYQICHKAKLHKGADVAWRFSNSWLQRLWLVKVYFYRFGFSSADFVEKRINKFLNMPASGFLSGLLIGGDSRLPAEVANSFRRTGMTHIVAVSGSNIAIIANALMAVGIFLGLWRRQAFYLVLAGVAFFIMMIGSPASAVRAGIMAMIILYALQNGRPSASGRILVLTAGVMVWLSPFILLYDVGFQLSFLATAGIIIFYGPLLKLVKGQEGFFGWKSILMVTVAAQLGVTGLLVYVFESFSLVSLPVNVLVLPVVPLVMIGGLLVILFSFLPGGLVWLVAWPTEMLLNLMLRVIEYFANFSGFYVVMKNVSWWILPIYYVILLLLGLFLNKKK